jgi:hypothetical protein
VVTQTRVQQVLVSCINRPHRQSSHEGITLIGGSGWMLTRAQAIAEIEAPNPRYSFYTNVGGKIAYVGVNEGPHGKYLQTHADGYWNNNLLALPECP